jgi:putative radical SAM enzyme (TIGR03279 family)
MKIAEVKEYSPLYGKIRKGFELLSINGEQVADNLDCLYKITEESVELEFRSSGGKTLRIQVENDYESDIGLRFEPDKIKVCRNKCIFCFIHQQPKGLRRSLYLRDDDFRLSFTHGNFISLSNLSEDDFQRIIKQRLSPLYVSVHSTDDDLRNRLFGKRHLPTILPALKRLIAGGIKFHTQVVICPDINDGDHLEKTINDLAGLYPTVASLGIVPVGLTRYRKRLPKLRSFRKDESEQIIRYIHGKQTHFRKELGSRFAFAADEFYISAGCDPPRLSEYEDMPQFENGVGMMRALLTDFNRRKRYLDDGRLLTNIALITGDAAFRYLSDHIVSYLKKKYRRKIGLFSVKNRFWGSKVNVSGLLTGRDILAFVNKLPKKYTTILLPPNCLNEDHLFLDDLSLDHLKEKSGRKIIPGKYSMIDTIKEVLV